MSLSKESCAPCRGGEGGVSLSAARELLPQVPGWQLQEEPPQIARRFSFADFKAAMVFVNRMAELAEAEGHHPDFTVRYKTLDVSLSTHDVGGLSRNDFILAAKIGEMFAARKD